MTERISSPDVAALLAHTRWLRRLAAHLVSGGDGADDAVQDTFVAALRARPSASEDLRPWLARVLRNALARRARTEGRRLAREQAVFAEPAQEPGAASLERLDLQRQLTDLVAHLEEPFRTTVVMRYFEEKSAAEIARTLGVPEGTIRWRTKEALDRLRAQLDERHGDRKVWSVALAPLALRRAARTTVAVGGAGALAAMAITVLAVAVWPGQRDGGGGGAGTSRWKLPRFSALLGGGPTAPGAQATIDGIVLAPDGKPVAGAVVTARLVTMWRPGGMSFGTERPLPAAMAVSDRGGSFKLAKLPAGKYVIAAADARHAGAYERDVEAPAAGRVELRLGAGGFPLSGQVLDQGGGPIPGARVMAQGRWLAMFTAVTSPQGEYRMMLPESISEIIVVASGYGPLRLSGRIQGEERRVLRLAPAARVSGQVLAGGRGVAGAAVRLLPVGSSMGRDRWEEEVTADEDGRFVIADLPAFEFRPFVRHGALVTGARTLLSLRAGGEERIQLPLERGATVRGRIRDPAGRPIAGAGVGVTEARRGGIDGAAVGTLVEMSADGNGRFVLEGIPPGPVDFHPAAMGYSPEDRTVDLGAQPVAEVELVLRPSIGVSGVVHRSDGSPAVNAEVRAKSRPANGRGGRASFGSADSAGRFEVRGLAQGDVTLTAWLGREAVLLAPFPLRDDEHKEVNIALRPGAFVSGVVKWDDGRPAAGVRVRGSGGPAAPRPGESIGYDVMIDAVLTDAQGKFTIGPFLPGEARLAAFAPGEREAGSSAPRPNQATILVAEGQQVGGAEMVLSTGSQHVAGTAMSRTGSALPGATLIAVQELPGRRPYRGDIQARQSISGGDGAFVLEGLARGTFTIFGRHPDHPDVQVAGVKAGTSDVKVRFPEPATITGTVALKRGVPAKEFFVAVEPVRPGERGPGTAEFPRLDVKDAKGAFTAPKLSPGTYDVTAMTSDGLVARASNVTLAEGETRKVRLVAEPGAALTGHVVDDATGTPAPSVQVTTRLPGLRSAEATTDSSGAFRLRGVLPGDKVRVTAHTEDGSFKVGRAEVDVPSLGVTIDVGTIRLSNLPDRAR
jgi:RNA polymerase sigma factor (sigma-70 family)